MAQTKSKAAKSSRSKQSSGGSKSSRSKQSSNGSKASRSKQSSNGSKASRSKQGSNGLEKAKVPLIAAGGAALVSAAGGAAYGATHTGRKVLGRKMPKPKRVKIRSKDLKKAAKEVGSFGDQVGDLTAELKRIRKGLGKA